MTATVITIPPDPESPIRFLYKDELRGLCDHGIASIRRASHVEPGDPDHDQDPLSWYADMAPSQGPILGPYHSRQEALTAEVGWLRGHLACRRQEIAL